MQIDAWHGTNRTFDAFARDHLGAMTGSASCLGFFFACDRESAEDYARMAERRGGGGARVIRARLTTLDPYEVPECGGLSTSAMVAILERARARGHDAVIFREILDSPLDLKLSDHVAVFDPAAVEILDAWALDDDADISPGP